MYDQVRHRDGKPRCRFHPGELVVGVCAVCLRERLLVLASKQGDASLPKSTSHQRSVKPKATVVPKFFALSSFLHRPESRRRRRELHESDQQLEDSFDGLEEYISVRFDDGRASWGRNTSANSHKKGNLPADGEKGGGVGDKSVVEHGGGLRWRKRVGHIFQVLRWKRSKQG